MKAAAHAPDVLERPGARDAVGEQDEIAVEHRIHPERCARESDVPESRGRQRGAARRGGQHRVPPEGARAAGHGAPPRGTLHERRREGEGQVPVAPRRAQHGPCERSDAPDGSEQPRVAGHAAEQMGVAVVHFPGELSAMPRVVVHRARRCRVAGGREGPELEEALRDHWRHGPGELHVERRPAPVSREESEEDEPDVAVHRAGSRHVLEPHRADLVLELPPSARRPIHEPGGQPRGVLQQIQDGGRLAIRSPPLREQASDGLARIQQSRGGKAHDDRRRRDRLGRATPDRTRSRHQRASDPHRAGWLQSFPPDHAAAVPALGRRRGKPPLVDGELQQPPCRLHARDAGHQGMRAGRSMPATDSCECRNARSSCEARASFATPPAAGIATAYRCSVRDRGTRMRR